ncbi:MAG: hypothetical protein JWR75_676 [Devosia sp.]|nr:hypothetical protein [Devosia sp.]
MPRGYWIGVAARQHVMMGVRDGYCMFAHGDHRAVEKLGAGDLFTYYAPMGGMGTGGQIRAFVAIGTVLDVAPEAKPMGNSMMGWQRGARYFEAEDASIYPLLGHLSFIKDAQHWGIHFRKSLFKVSEADFRVIAEAMNAAPAIALLEDAKT